jgi:CHAT domain-containing protein
VGLAEAFLRGGVANYVGTYWPVGDEAAECFAQTFYTDLLNKKPIGEALLAGRDKVRNGTKSVDWADYIHYGSYDFVLKQE